MSHRRRWPVVVALAVGILSVATGPPGPARGQTATPPAAAPVTLQGEGSWDPIGEMTTWQNELYGSSGAINLNYLANAGFAGRQDYLAGGLDYVISGVPFTSAELAMLPHGADDLIDAPVQVSAMGVMVARPKDVEHPGFSVFHQVCDPNNPPDPLPPGLSNPESCANIIPFTGSIRIPADNLSAMLLGYGGGRPILRNWNNPEVVKAFGVTVRDPSDFMGGLQNGLIPGQVGPQVFLRSEPSETSYYLQSYVFNAAPTVRSAIEAANRQTFGTFTERLAPGLAALQTRPGVDQQMSVFKGVGGSPGAGAMIPVPPWALATERTGPSSIPAEWVEVQNASHEWVAPTPATINAAVNAGGDTPLYALDHQVPGAYPIVWVDHLYAPAHGLSIAKTEALATTIRYMATSGQAVTATVGDGQLSTALVTKALAAANQLVVSNCTGAGMTVMTSSDPGPLAPPLKGLQSIGPMAHCITTPPSPTTTTVATTIAPSKTASSTTVTTGSHGSRSTGGPGQSTTGTSAPDQSPPGAVPPKPAADGVQLNSAVILAKLPLPSPGSGVGQFDRFTAFIVGAALLLLARKPVRGLIRTLQT